MERLYQPVFTLKPVAEDIWIVDGPAIGFYGLPFTTRMTVVRLRSGELWLHSPVAADPGLVAAVTELGRVGHLVSPNWIHYAWLPDWERLFPEAVVWAAPGVRARAAGRGVEIAWDADLGPEAPEAWAGEMRQKIVTGSRLHVEVVFFHEASRTLILTDLIENFEAGRLPWPMRALAWLGGVLHPHGGMPRDMRASFRGNRAELAAHVTEMIGWGPERVILAHGRWFAREGAAELARAFAWLDLKGQSLSR